MACVFTLLLFTLSTEIVLQTFAINKVFEINLSLRVIMVERRRLRVVAQVTNTLLFLIEDTSTFACGNSL